MKQSVLRIEHLSKTYGKRMVIRDISMIARQGESVGLLGPNGAGKPRRFTASQASWRRPAVKFS